MKLFLQSVMFAEIAHIAKPLALALRIQLFESESKLLPSGFPTTSISPQPSKRRSCSAFYSTSPHKYHSRPAINFRIVPSFSRTSDRVALLPHFGVR